MDKNAKILNKKKKKKGSITPRMMLGMDQAICIFHKACNEAIGDSGNEKCVCLRLFYCCCAVLSQHCECVPVHIGLCVCECSY